MSSSSQAISLEEISKICSSLGKLMQDLMDRNTVALIVGSTGEVTFTKQGTKVLSEASLSHPIEKLIVNACNKYHVKTGEDSKLFLLLMVEIMYGVKTMLTKYDDMYVRKTLSLEVASFVSFTPNMFESIRRISAIVSNPSDSFKSYLKDLNGIVQTFISSRFSHFVSKELSRLICEFLVDSISDWNNAGEALQYLISHFDVFCSKALLPLHKSSIMKGFLLHQRFISSLPQTSHLQFVVIWDVSQKSDGICWSVQVGSLPLQLSTHWKIVEESLSALKSRGVSVILTPSVSCENFKSHCSQCEITLIDNIPSEDIANIMFFTTILPMNTLKETLEQKNIACIQNIRSVSFDNFYYTHLEVLASKGSIVPNHIVLCALTDSLWKEYYAEFYNCLKVVKQWIVPSIHFFLLQDQSETKRPITDCGEILWIVEHLKAECESLQRSNLYSETLNKTCVDNCGISKSCNLGFSYPLGLWEFIFQVELTSASFPKQSFPNLCNILECALLKTVCQIWSIPLRKYDGQKSYSDFYCKVKGKESNPIVPVLSKEDQFLEVLLLLQQLLKIDAIVGSK